MDDIARRAGVCKATVSRTLNDPDRVSESTRARVMKVVEEIGYTPNRLAASLRQGRSYNIAVLLPDISNPYISPIVRSVERVAQLRGYSVILKDTQDDPELERSFTAMVNTRQVDGIITNSQRIPFDISADRPVADQIPPIVNASEFCDLDGIHKVGVDNVAIGRDATEHLLQLGHTRIATITGPSSILSSKQREQGFLAALNEAGVAFDERLKFEGDYSSESGCDGVQKLMQLKNRPTAIFCFGDLVAMGAMHALRELGYRIPDDISIISVDGIALSQYCAPPLTTVAQPLTLIGEQCATTLIDLIEGRKPEKLINILPHQLLTRASTAPIPGFT
ncbi:LacI family DNA-binding transcriptional regulator [Microbulbifer magnicolonia]|uniref:LacI family DNA-binding transcriptional regulator n=1 Tax=Microbulbifer magnicolonia TaxID=3109744 RepID=UPI002B40D5F2|nr:LacI family DNA-binding transcriptional regulator [Microbulbifer sp. GG15]